MTLLLVAAFFVFVMALISSVGYLFLRHAAVSEPAAEISGTDAPGGAQQRLVEMLASAGALLPKGDPDTQALRRRLLRAGYRSASAVAIFHGLQLTVALGLGGIAGWATGFLRNSHGGAFLVPVLCAACFGYMLPGRVLAFQGKARKRKIKRAIPPALDLMVLAMEAGQSLDQALQDTAATLRGIYPDLSSELAFCYLEMRAGTSRQEALHRLGEHSGEEEMKRLAGVLIDGERFGASLGPALRAHSRYLRTRLRQQAQEAARKLPVKLVIPVFFLIFPAVMLVTLGPAYLQLRQFFKDFLGA